VKNYLKIILLFIIVLLLVIFIPGLDGSYVKNAQLYINEVMASNKYTLKDDDHETSDYIEIYNGYNYDLNLSGYYLSDSEYEPKKWKFPNITINSNSYLIIYASGKDKFNLENKIMHTNFKLSNLGEILVLSDPDGNIISKISYPEMSPDISYGYARGKYFLMEPTPRETNRTEKYQRRVTDLTDKVIINEYMTNNQRYNYDQSGNYSDWIELYNQTNEDLLLQNIYLSDNENKLNKYKLPEVTIKSHSYLLIYLSEKNEVDQGEIHANFKLSTNEKLILSDGKNIFDEITTVELLENISYGLKDNQWYYFTSPTPGVVNDTASFTSIGGDNNGNS